VLVAQHQASVKQQASVLIKRNEEATTISERLDSTEVDNQ
jgi:hypothetical protein